MAIASVLTAKPATIVASTTAQSVTLDTDCEYLLFHTGLGASLAADENPIFISTDSTVAVDDTEGSDKLILTVGVTLPIGPGIANINIDVAAGAPRLCVIKSPRVFGAR